jgi:hypothetical protein
MYVKWEIRSASRMQTTGGGNRFHLNIEARTRSAVAGIDSSTPREFVRLKHRMSLVARCRLLLGIAALSTIMTGAALADEPLFGFAYTTDLLPQGGKEIEQWLSWRHQKNSGSYDQLEHRTEFSYGITDRLQASLYLNYNWTQAFHNGPFGATTPPEQFADFQVGPDDHFNKTRFSSVSGELIYRILSPYTDPIGLAVYAEPSIGPNFREVETRVILQKNFFDDLLVLAFNFTYAPEFRYLLNDAGTAYGWQEETDVNFTFGASYRFIENWSAGFEITNEHEYNSFWFNHESNSGYYLGPTIHYGGERFFVTATALWQMPWATSHTDTVPGALVGGYIGDNDFERFRLRIKAGFTF